MFNKREDSEPILRKKEKLDLSFFKKNIYLVVLGLVFILGTSFGLTFFIQNKKIGEITLTVGDITYTVTQDKSISINNLKMNVPNNKGLFGYSKEITIRNTSDINGKLELKINRTSGVPLEGLRYGLYINDVLIDVSDMPSDGIIYHSAILGNEQVKAKVVLWLKEDYSTNETTFVGDIEENITLDSLLASTYLNSLDNLNNNYVKFNGNEIWRIKGVEDGSIVVTKTEYLNNTFTNSNLFNVSNTLTDDSLVVSMSTDNKAYYLKKTVKIVGGSGTESDPYILGNDIDDINDRKIVGYITYNNEGTNLTPKQPIYYGETNYIGMNVNDMGFLGWSTTSSGTLEYKLGDTFNISSNTTLYTVFGPLPALEAIIKNVNTTTQINFADPSSDTNGKGLYILPGTENDTHPIYYYRGEISNNNVVFGGFCWQIVRTTDTGGIKMIYNGAVTENGTTCENTTAASRQLSSISAFNTQYNSVADVGYMKNARYVSQSTTSISGVYFGTSIEYGKYDVSNPGTNVYRLVDDGNGSVGTTLDGNHHYSCNSVAATGTCTTVRYYYNENDENGTTYRYIILTGGETIEDALYKMTGNGDETVRTRNAGYVLNNIDSTAKVAIESWFRTNLTNEVDSSKRNYAIYLEDTVYCNDRSYKTATGKVATYEQSGWNPSGGDLTKNIYFGPLNRAHNEWYSDTNVPTILCPNETDRFSVSSSIAHLNYPVGLLTADEIVMAGASGTSQIANQTYYLYSGDSYWSMSPYGFLTGYAYDFWVSASGQKGGKNVLNTGGLRPVISLKPGTEFERGGDGTVTNPYVAD